VDPEPKDLSTPLMMVRSIRTVSTMMLLLASRAARGHATEDVDFDEVDVVRPARTGCDRRQETASARLVGRTRVTSCPRAE